MKFFSRRKSKNPIKRPCSFPHLEYLNFVVRCRSCVSRRREPHRGQRRISAGGILAVEEFSPINRINFSVEPAEIFRSSYLSNQKARHGMHTSIVKGAVKCASTVIEVISAEQPGHFTRVGCASSPQNKQGTRPRRRTVLFLRARRSGKDVHRGSPSQRAALRL